MAKKTTNGPTASLQQLVTYYEKGPGVNFDSRFQVYQQFFASNIYSDLIKAEIALIGAHQARLNDIHGQRKYAQDAIRKLANAKLWTNKYACFQNIYDDVARILKGIKHVKGLAIYDCALRISSCSAGCRPNEVYLNAGAWKGACALLGQSNVTPKMSPQAFPVPLCNIVADHIEDFLCIYKDLLTYGGIKPNAILPKYYCSNKNCWGYRSNMLGYQIFVQKKVNVTSMVMTVSYP